MYSKYGLYPQYINLYHNIVLDLLGQFNRLPYSGMIAANCYELITVKRKKRKIYLLV